MMLGETKSKLTRWKASKRRGCQVVHTSEVGGAGADGPPRDCIRSRELGLHMTPTHSFEARQAQAYSGHGYTHRRGLVVEHGAGGVVISEGAVLQDIAKAGD